MVALASDNFLHHGMKYPVIVPFMDISMASPEDYTCTVKLLDYFLPDWEVSRCSSSVSCQALPSGITNKLLKCESNHNKENVALIRIYGPNTEVLIDRDREVKVS